MSDLTGHCFCGAVHWRSRSRILWAAHCHCEDCRRAASSDYVSWLGVERQSVEWSGPRKIYRSSLLVVRSFCDACGSPLSYETEVFEDETHLYAATLDDSGVYKPTAHIFWSERLSWVNVSDGLPTHAKDLQDATGSGQTLLHAKK